ncbi:MAG TPA: hypothetical protein ENN97_06385 [Phycisphaerales bacterium]|nr:hypothetical protein [Phycisphaerales bacterium]
MGKAIFKKTGIGIISLLLAALVFADEGGSFWDDFSPPQIHGFYEMRGGYRTQNDRYQKDKSVMETRLQIEASTFTDWADFKFKGDLLGDFVLEEGDFDFREGWVFARPTEYLDVKIGRQILTWGTGDLLFINDLFPKDWQAFFIGRDVDYLKAPSDAAKLSFFTELINIDIVYTPQFDPDRYVRGERLSYWYAPENRRAGRDRRTPAERPDDWFRDDEIAVRLYRTISNYEVALYGYRGFWKSPAGQSPTTGRPIFPDLNAYGASVRGPLGSGIANAEIGYYESADDKSGKDPLINNSEMRYLVGYTQEIVADLNAGVQYYIEQMLDYSAYKRSHPTGSKRRDRDRHVVTLRLTQLLWNQNLELSMFTYYSPSDNDAYLRPSIHYKATDHLALETGANVFVGKSPHTFFGQFEDNTNIYAAVRYSF